MKLSKFLWIICYVTGAIGAILGIGGAYLIAATRDIIWLIPVISGVVALLACGIFAILAVTRGSYEKNCIFFRE